MDPVDKIKQHVVDLNSLLFNDDAGLERFMGDVKRTIRSVFGEYDHYLTYLSSIYFRPAFLSNSPEEEVRSWAMGKRQLRELLLVMAEDPRLKILMAGETVFSHEIAEAERIVARHVSGVAIDVATLPRVRIDLRDVNILNSGVEDYLLHDIGKFNKVSAGKVLVIPCHDVTLNEKISRFLKEGGAEVVFADDPVHANRSLNEQLADHTDIRMAIVVLGQDCQLDFQGVGRSSTLGSPAPAACFSLGYLVSALGRGRVAALYCETDNFYRPTPFFEVYYISVDEGRLWTRELTARLQQNHVDISNADPD